MSGVFTTKSMIQSIANNRAMLKKRRLKHNPYLQVNGVRQGNVDYQELKAWRLSQAKQRVLTRWTVFIILMVTTLSTAAVLQLII